MKQPAISIIVPVYNAEKYLRRCIDSILSQSLTDFELILIDDGSTDRSPHICDEYATRDKRIKLIHKKNAGVSAARNDGLDIAQGEFITFVDSDDWVDVNYLKSLYDNKAYDYIIGTFINEPQGKVQYLEEGEFFGDNLKEYVSVTHLSNGYPWGKLFKSKIISENILRFKNIKVYEDLLFCLEYVRNCSSIYCMSKANYHYFNPVQKSVPEKFPLTIHEVAWLYQNTKREIVSISKIFKSNPVTLPFNFYLHLDLKDLYDYGDDKNLYKAYNLLHPDSSQEEYYNDMFASPIILLLDRINQLCSKEYRKCIAMMRLLNSNKHSFYLTRINHRSRTRYVCAYCIKYKLYPLVIVINILVKIIFKIFSK